MSTKIPFLGFTFNGQHSLDFGIIRVIDGDRYQENLLPEFQDITQEIEGMEGVLYYGTIYKKKDFNIKFAFDNLTEEKLSNLKKWLNTKTIATLEFDERPDVLYSAKIANKVVISHIPFDGEVANSTVYKGEGNITFTCYFPFGRKTINGKKPSNNISTFEIGDVASYPKIVIDGLDSEVIIRKGSSTGDILLKINGTGLNKTITIDCEEFLIYDANGNIYNHKITAGDFFSIPSSEYTIYFSIDKDNNNVDNNITISYDQLYY